MGPLRGLSVCRAIAGNATPSRTRTGHNLSSCHDGILAKSNKRSYFVRVQLVRVKPGAAG